MSRTSLVLTLVSATVIAAGLPLAAAAEGYFGGNAVNSRINEGDFDGHETGWKAFVGLNANRTLGLEMGYIDFGRYGVENSGANAWTPAVTLGLPLGPIDLYGKGGVAFADFEGTSVREESKNNDPFFGFGLRFGMPNGLGLRAEYERYRFDTADIDVAMAGLEFRFGSEPSRPYR